MLPGLRGPDNGEGSSHISQSGSQDIDLEDDSDSDFDIEDPLAAHNRDRTLLDHDFLVEPALEASFVLPECCMVNAS